MSPSEVAKYDPKPAPIWRRDSFLCSFGTDQEFADDGSEDAYLQWLRERLSEWSDGCVHVWCGGTIIGQMEMRLRDEPGLGYINLFYLVPEARGSGAGDLCFWPASCSCK